MDINLNIPLGEVQRRLSLDNPWWRAGEGIDAREADWTPRAYFRKFAKLALDLTVQRVVVLMGQRGVGKTVMIKHLIDRLLQYEGFVGTQVLYIPLNTPLYSGRPLGSG